MKATLPGGGVSHPQVSRCWPWVTGLLLLGAAFLAYQPVWHAGFIWDDDYYVTGNATLRDWAGLWQIWFKVGAVPQYYPLVHTTFWLEYRLWGLHPLGYHLDNVLLHALAALLLGRVLRRLQVPGAWLAAALFALHPVQVESVAWVTERKNVLSAVFYFAAALAYLRFTEKAEGGRQKAEGCERWPSSILHLPASGWYGLALVLFVCALLSKTVTCSLPAALLLVGWWKRGRLRAGDLLPLLPFFAMGAGLGWQTAWMEKHQVGAQGVEWSLTIADRCLVAGRALWFYAGKLAWPAQLTFIYPRWEINAGLWWQWIFPAAAAGVVTALWFLRTRTGRGPLVGVLFFAGTLGPALGFVNVYPMRYSFVADHFQYLAGVGLFALAGAGMARLLARLRLWARPAGNTLCLGLLLLPAGLTWRQCGMYADLETLWRTTLTRNPGCWMAHSNLGATLASQGKPVEAEMYLREALELKPDYAEVHCNLGIALASQGKLDEAIQSYGRALQLDPDDARTHNNLGVALAAQRKFAEAVRHYQRALQLKPDDAKAHNNLGIVLADQGKFAEAIPHHERALQLEPGYVEFHCNLGLALAAQGNLTEAIQCFERALQLKPDDAEARFGLGNALADQGKLEEARQQFQQALDLAMARNNTGLAEFIRARLNSFPAVLPGTQSP